MRKYPFGARTPSRQTAPNTKARWSIERDYQELKQELGLSHYEGRIWRGFHHHASLCIAAYSFLIGEHRLSPTTSVLSASGSKPLRFSQASSRAVRPARPALSLIATIRRQLAVRL